MGQGESRNTASNLGLHVLRVAEGSPAADAGIEPFFDHIVGYNGLAMTEDTDAFQAEVERTEQRKQIITLQVWSSKREELRDVRIAPSQSWSLPTKAVLTHEDAQPSLLGLSLRLCSPEGALEQVWHILDILEGSPAQSAGLVAFGDYVIGYAGGVMKKEGDFYDLIEQHANKPCRLFVYNADFDVTREVVIVPNRDWGTGEGLLGCGVGYGLLHRIPKPQDRLANPAELSERPTTPPTAQRTASSRSVHTPEEESDSDENTGVSLIDTSSDRPAQNGKPPAAREQSNRPGGLNLDRLPAQQFNYQSNRATNGPPPSPGSQKTRSSVAEVVVEEDEE